MLSNHPSHQYFLPVNISVCVCVCHRELRPLQHLLPTCCSRVVSAGEGRGRGGGARALGERGGRRRRGDESPGGGPYHRPSRGNLLHQCRDKTKRYVCFGLFVLGCVHA